MPDTEQNDILQELFARGTLMSVHVGRWLAQQKASMNDFLREDVGSIANTHSLGKKRYLPPEAVEALQGLEKQARKIFYDRSVDFPVSGARFVANHAIGPLVEQLRDLRLQWLTEVDRLLTLAVFEAHKNTQLKALEASYDKFVADELSKIVGDEPARLQAFQRLVKWKAGQMESDRLFYPSLEELRPKFKFYWRTFEISPQRESTTVPNSALAEAQRELQADLQGWIHSAAAEMHQTLGQAAAHAAQMLADDGKLTEKSLRPLLRAFEVFKATDFTNASEFRTSVERIQTELLNNGTDLAATAEATTREDFRERLMVALNQVGALTAAEMAAEAGTKAVRKSRGQVADV
jgi:hypothetical protein